MLIHNRNLDRLKPFKNMLFEDFDRMADLGKLSPFGGSPQDDLSAMLYYGKPISMIPEPDIQKYGFDQYGFEIEYIPKWKNEKEYMIKCAVFNEREDFNDLCNAIDLFDYMGQIKVVPDMLCGLILGYGKINVLHFVKHNLGYKEMMDGLDIALRL